jgi:hypothetical protein
MGFCLAQTKGSFVFDCLPRGGCPQLRATALRRLCANAITAHEHALIDQLFERAHGPGLMQSAFVATDGCHAARILEG